MLLLGICIIGKIKDLKAQCQSRTSAPLDKIIFDKRSLCSAPRKFNMGRAPRGVLGASSLGRLGASANPCRRGMPPGRLGRLGAEGRSPWKRAVASSPRHCLIGRADAAMGVHEADERKPHRAGGPGSCCRSRPAPATASWRALAIFALLLLLHPVIACPGPNHDTALA